MNTIWRAVTLTAAVGLMASLSAASGPDRTKQPVRVAPAAPKAAVPVQTPASAPPVGSQSAGKVEGKKLPLKPLPAPSRPSGLRGVGNDECSGALSLGNANPAVANFDNSLATTGLDGQGNAACLFFGSTVIDLDEWFTWTSPVTGQATLQACGQTVDTKVAVYSGATCPPGAPLACNDDSCGLQSSVTFGVTTGQVYLFQIGTYPGATPGAGSFTCTATASGGGPANDDCSGAITITAPSVTAGDTTTALPELGLTTCGTTYTNAPGVWYKYVGNDRNIDVTTCDAGSSYDTKLHVFRGSCGSLICVTGNDDDATCTAPGFTPPNYRSRLQFCALAGTDYYILVHGFGTNAGAFNLVLSDLGACSATTNDECATATTITGALPLAFPADTTQGTTGADGQTEGACLFFGTTAIDHDLWFKWTSTVTGAVKLEGCGGHTDDTKIAVYSGNTCPPFGAIACNDDSCGLTSSLTFNAVSGTDYLFQIGAYPGSAGGSGNFTLSIPCSVTAPGGALEENEADCGLPVDFVNGGCNSAPEVFTNIQCGQTFHGTAGNDGATRDTDWYQITLNANHAVTWTVTSEFAALMGFIEGSGDGSCGSITGFVNPFAITAGDCAPVSVTTPPIGPGTFWFFVAPSGFGGVTCGADYVAALTFAEGGCVDAATGACCAAGSCSITTQAACTGTYLGDNSSCTTAGTSQDFSNSPNIPIPDASCPTNTTDTINVAPSFTVADVNVLVNIPDHTFIGDLVISLTHGATTVVLWNAQCGGNDGMTVTFDDSGSAVVCGSPTVGTYKSNQLLSAFNGSNSSGSWTLNVCDGAGADIGTLVNWTVSIAPPGPSPCPTGPDCFTRGPVAGAASCSPTYTASAHNRPVNAGHFSVGGANGAADTAECLVDWDGNGCILPSDVASFVTSAFYDFQNGTSDAQITCGGGPTVPATVASFVTRWFNALSNPAGEGCTP